MFIASSVKLCPSSVRSDMDVVSGNPALYLFNELKSHYAASMFEGRGRWAGFGAGLHGAQDAA